MLFSMEYSARERFYIQILEYFVIWMKYKQTIKSNLMSQFRITFFSTAVVGIFVPFAIFAQNHTHEMDADGHMMHDEVNMPMLNGKDTTEAEVDALRHLFQNHGELERSVMKLPNGIQTVTETENEELRAYLVSHVSDMMARVEENRDPEIPIQSRTLDGIFLGHEEIETTVEATDQGVTVTQISDNPEIVELLHQHAGEIDDMVARGMDAVHERMMREMGH